MLQVTTKELFGAEQNLAHYTRPKVAFALLGDKKNPATSFRLSSIRGVNDPTEGDVLLGWLGFESEKNENLATFISCFTFNHDSLNQFRLYGKENNEEASGVSLVVNSGSFFEQNRYSLGISSGILMQKVDGFLDKNNTESNSSTVDDENKVSKLPLYRCIYLDLESDYISLASREEITFLRENQPTVKFRTYSKEIKNKQKQVKQKLVEIRNKVREINNMLKDKDREIVTHILLPLRYLVKHAAFKEEQEARIFYITSLFDSKIQINPEYNQMYLEYAQPVKSAIHKIYLSPGAEKYQDFFRRCLSENSADKIRISSNPFRSRK